MDTSALFKCFLLSTLCLLQWTWAQSDEAYCTRVVSISKTVYVQVSRTQTIATYYRCWVFWTCTTYRYATVYSSEARTQTTYGTNPVCCEGYTYEQYVCVRLRGPDTNVPTKTTLIPTDANRGNGIYLPTGNTSLPTDRLPGNGTSTTEPTTTPSKSSTTTNRLGATSLTPLTSSPSNMTSLFDKRITKMPTGAKVFFGVLAGVIVIACITVAACLVHRRQRKRLNQNIIDTMHMGPLRDLQVLSEHGTAVQHFSPPFAPDDEYAVVNKGTDATDSPGSKDQDKPYYVNTVIQEDTTMTKNKIKKEKGEKGKSHLNSLADKMMHPKSKRLTHTYMDGAAFSPSVPEGHAWGRDTPGETCYTEVDEDQCATTEDRKDSKQNVYEAIEEADKTMLTCDQLETCYTEVDNDICASTENQIDSKEDVYEAIERADKTVLTYDHLERDNPTSRDNSKETEDLVNCGEVAGKYGVLAQLSSADNRDNRQDVYEAIEEADKTMLIYDHLERDNPTSRDTSKEAEAHENEEELAGKYGVLAQSSSVDNHEHYDQFLRSVSHTPDQPSDNGYGSINESQTNDQRKATEPKLSSDTPALAYDDIRRGLPNVSGKKASSLAGLLHSATVRAAYGHLGSSMESDPGEPSFNKDLRFSGVAASDRDSTYTDMSGSFRNSTASARSSDHQTYTPMSPFPDMPDGVTFFNVSVGGEQRPQPAAGNNDQYASILESKDDDTYDHVERKLDGARLDVSMDIPGDHPESRSGKANANLIYENM